MVMALQAQETVLVAPDEAVKNAVDSKGDAHAAGATMQPAAYDVREGLAHVGVHSTHPQGTPQDRLLLSALRRRRDRVFAVLACAFGVSRRALMQARREDPRAVFARQVGLYLLHVVFSLPMQTVGQICGKDRTTVAHACRRVEDCREDAAFDAFMHDLELAVSALESAVDMRHRHGL